MPGQTILLEPDEVPMLIATRRVPGGQMRYIFFGTDDMNHKHYALMAVDIVRHVAKAFAVPEAEVWRYVEMERATPTSPIYPDTAAPPEGSKTN